MSIKPAPKNAAAIADLIAAVVAAAANDVPPPAPSAASSARTAPAVEELSEPGDHPNYAPKEQQ